MRLARHGRCRQAPQDVGTHQGDSKAKGTRCVPSATLRQQKKVHQRVPDLLAATGLSGRRGHPQTGKKKL
ncbi:MAG: hypothetical protein DUD39_07355 [Coriobacteriaceae bacterium]|nr:MAG: hypothetical protein DUD39_07355 [Coriobacteriaceae bacterium]